MKGWGTVREEFELLVNGWKHYAQPAQPKPDAHPADHARYAVEYAGWVKLQRCISEAEVVLKHSRDDVAPMQRPSVTELEAEIGRELGPFPTANAVIHHAFRRGALWALSGEAEEIRELRKFATEFNLPAFEKMKHELSSANVRISNQDALLVNKRANLEAAQTRIRELEGEEDRTEATLKCADAALKLAFCARGCARQCDGSCAFSRALSEYQARRGVDLPKGKPNA